MAGVAAAEEEGRREVGVGDDKGFRVTESSPWVVAVFGHEVAVGIGDVGDASEVVASDEEDIPFVKDLLFF